MKKLIFAFFAAVLIFSCTQAQKQSDFYGTWKLIYDKNETVSGEDDYEDEDEAVWVENKITITKDTFVSTSLFEDEEGEFSESGSSDIISWESTVNNDNNTRNDYPSGYLIKTKYIEYYFYLHKNKKNLLSISKWKNDEIKSLYAKEKS